MKGVIIIARRISMKNIKEILRLASTGSFSARQIAKSCNCSPSTVAAVLERANNAELEKVWPLIKYWITALQTQKESEWRRK